MATLIVDTERRAAQPLDLGAACILRDNTLNSSAAAWQMCEVCDEWVQDDKPLYMATVSQCAGSLRFNLRTRYPAYRCESCQVTGWSSQGQADVTEAATGPSEQLSPVHTTATYTLQGADEGVDLTTATQEFIMQCPDCGHCSPPLPPQQVEHYILAYLEASSAAGRPCCVLQASWDKGIYADPAAYGGSISEFEVPYTVEQLLARLAVLVANYVLTCTRHAAAAAAAAAAGPSAAPAATSSNDQLQQLRTWAIKTLRGSDTFLSAANYVRPHLRGLARGQNKPSLLDLVLAPPYTAVAGPEAGMIKHKLAVLLCQHHRHQQQQQQHELGAAASPQPAAADAQKLLADLLQTDPYFGHQPADTRVRQFLAVLGISSIAEVTTAMQDRSCINGTRQHLKVCADCGWNADNLHRQGLSTRLAHCRYCLVCSGCAWCRAQPAAGRETSAAAAAAAESSIVCRWCANHVDLDEMVHSSMASGSGKSKRRRLAAADAEYSAAAADDEKWGTVIRKFDSSNTIETWNQGRQISAAQLDRQCQQLGKLQLTESQRAKILGGSLQNKWTLVNPPSRLIPPGFVMILVARNGPNRPGAEGPDFYCYAPDEDATKLRSGCQIRQWLKKKQQQDKQEQSNQDAAAAAGEEAAVEGAADPKRPKRAAAIQCGQRFAEWLAAPDPASIEASSAAAAAGGGGGGDQMRTGCVDGPATAAAAAAAAAIPVEPEPVLQPVAAAVHEPAPAAVAAPPLAAPAAAASDAAAVPSPRTAALVDDALRLEPAAAAAVDPAATAAPGQLSDTAAAAAVQLCTAHAASEPTLNLAGHAEPAGYGLQQQPPIKQEPGSGTQQQQQQHHHGEAIPDVIQIDLVSDSECDTEDHHIDLDKTAATSAAAAGRSSSSSDNLADDPHRNVALAQEAADDAADAVGVTAQDSRVTPTPQGKQHSGLDDGMEQSADQQQGPASGQQQTTALPDDGKKQDHLQQPLVPLPQLAKQQQQPPLLHPLPHALAQQQQQSQQQQQHPITVQREINADIIKLMQAANQDKAAQMVLVELQNKKRRLVNSLAHSGQAAAAASSSSAAAASGGGGGDNLRRHSSSDAAAELEVLLQITHLLLEQQPDHSKALRYLGRPCSLSASGVAGTGVVVGAGAPTQTVLDVLMSTWVQEVRLTGCRAGQAAAAEAAAGFADDLAVHRFAPGLCYMASRLIVCAAPLLGSGTAVDGAPGVVDDGSRGVELARQLLHGTTLLLQSYAGSAAAPAEATSAAAVAVPSEAWINQAGLWRLQVWGSLQRVLEAIETGAAAAATLCNVCADIGDQLQEMQQSLACIQ